MSTEDPGLLHVMLVESDPIIGEVVALSLKLDAKVVVAVARDGSTAVSRLRESSAYDVVLIDEQLADISGIDLADTIRSMYRIPVMFLTAAVRVKDRERHREVGVIGVIAKPFDPLTLADEVRRLLVSATDRR